MKKIILFLVLYVFLSPVAQAKTLDIQTFKTPAGITVWLVEDHSIPVISMNFVFRGAGSVNDPVDKQGLSQMLSNTLDEGAGDLDSQAFQGELDNKSITLRFSSGRDNFGGTVKTLTKNYGLAFELLRSALIMPRFDQEAIGRMREANLSRIRGSMTDPEWLNARLMNEVLFKGHPYAMNSGGTLSSLPRITAEDLRQKLKTQFGRDNLLIAIAGDLQAEQVVPLIDQTFGNLPEQSTVVKVNDIAVGDIPQTVLYKKEIPQSVVNMALSGLRIDDPDYFAAEIMNFVLGSSGFGSRLTDEIREKRGLTYGIYSDLNEMDHTTLLTINAATKNESASELISLTKEVMEKMAGEVITTKELQDAKTYLVGSIPLQLTSTDRISGAMAGFMSYGLPPNYLDIRAEKLRSVTIADVKRVSERLLKRDNLQIVIVGNPKIGDTATEVKEIPNIQ